MPQSHAAEKVGLSRKTVLRWRTSIPGFGDAIDAVLRLRKCDDGEAEICRIVTEWTPVGIYRAEVSEAVTPDVLGEDGSELLVSSGGVDLEADQDALDEDPGDDVPDEPSAAEPEPVGVDVSEPSAPEPPPEHEPEPSPEPEPVVIEVREAPSPRPLPAKTAKPPKGSTCEEWITLLYTLASDVGEDPGVRRTAIVAGAAAVLGGPVGRQPLGSKAIDVEGEEREKALREGRPRGVSRKAWREVREKFLGPPLPAAEESETEQADVVEISAASG